MRQSRYTWLMIISSICMLVMIYWAGPQTVWSALAKGDFANAPSSAVQRFWNALDVRQIETADNMFVAGKNEQGELKYWTEFVSNDPLLRLQQVEYLNKSENNFQVKVTWINERQKYEYYYSISLIETEEGWKIQSLDRLVS